MSAVGGDRFSGPLFIVGMPRSGTKLLRAVLNSNLAVRIPRVETEILPYIVENFESFGDVSRRENFEHFFVEISQYPFFFYLEKQGEMITAEQWYMVTKEYTPAGVFESLVRLVTGLGWNLDGIWGDKSPSYVGHLSLLKSLYPHAKFIHIVRDVRDYCLSINHAWGKNKLRAASKWSEGVQEVSRFAENNAECIRQLRYEDLLRNPETEIKRLAEFLGIDISVSMLTLDASTENIGDAKGQSKIVSCNTEKFRTALTRQQLLCIEEAAFDAMNEYDYKPEVAVAGRPPSKLLMISLQFLDAVNLVMSARQEMGLWGAIRFHFLYKRATSASGSLK